MVVRLLLLIALMLPAGALAASLPPIIASATNPVPKCVQPHALMDFVQRINERRRMSIAPRFEHIATL